VLVHGCVEDALKSRVKRLRAKLSGFRAQKKRTTSKDELLVLHREAKAYLESKKMAATLELDKGLVKAFKVTLQNWEHAAQNMCEEVVECHEEEESEEEESDEQSEEEPPPLSRPARHPPKRQAAPLESGPLKRPARNRDAQAILAADSEKMETIQQLREQVLQLEQRHGATNVTSAVSPFSQVKTLIRGAGEISALLVEQGFVQKPLTWDEAIIAMHKAQIR